MYESFFGFDERPFSHAPNAAQYFPAAGIEQARQTLASCVERASGPGVLIGPPGVGKTLLCYVLADQFRDQFQVATLGGASVCTRRALLQNILFELKRPYRDMEEGELRLSLMDYLEPGPSCPNGLLLIVDEAHTLPMRLVEELRLMTNFVRDGHPRIRLIVSGTVALEERLANPKLESFNQRVTARCYLQSLGYEEQCHYLRAQIAAAGGDPDQLLDESALLAVYRAADGVPRIVNQIMDHTFVLAFAAGERRINGRSVEQAWADLQQLPAPWIEEESTNTQSDSVVIEFGELDDIAQPYVDDQMDESDIEISDLSDLPPEESLHAESPSLRVAPFEDEHEFEVDGDQGVELNEIQPAVNPFDEHFEEEEVILDRYASLDNANLRSGLHVTSVSDNPWQLLAELTGEEINELSPKSSDETSAATDGSDPWASVASGETPTETIAVGELAEDDPWSNASSERADAPSEYAPVNETSHSEFDYSTDLGGSTCELPDVASGEQELYEMLIDPASDPVLPEREIAGTGPGRPQLEIDDYADAQEQVETLVRDVRSEAGLHSDRDACESSQCSSGGCGTGRCDSGQDQSIHIDVVAPEPIGVHPIASHQFEPVTQTTSEPAHDESLVDVEELLSFGSSTQHLELRVAPTDDRDMLIIEDDPTTIGNVNHGESLSHPDYQQILSQMRQS